MAKKIKTIEKVNKAFKLGVLEYLKYERDERKADMIEGGYSEEESISVIEGINDGKLLGLIDTFIKEETPEAIDKNWKNYDDTDYDSAFCCYLWEWICEQEDIKAKL